MFNLQNAFIYKIASKKFFEIECIRINYFADCFTRNKKENVLGI